MPFQIIRDDITKLKVDATVNTANPEPTYGRGTDYAIYMAAGKDDLLAERKKIGYIAPGDVAVTSGFDLPSMYIIHAVGPVWRGGSYGEYDILSSCYSKSLEMAKQLGCRSIAFPLISAGTYGFPKDKALKIALESIGSFLSENDMDVKLVVFNKEAYEISRELMDDVRQYVDDHYVERREREYYHALDPNAGGGIPSSNAPSSGPAKAAVPPAYLKETGAKTEKKGARNRKEKEGSSFLEFSKVPFIGSAKREESAKIEDLDLADIVNRRSENFQAMLLRLIDEKKYSDVEVYKRANLDRKLFSKLRSNQDYKPAKKTALALAVALKLNMDETSDLLGRAGFALSPSSRADLIVQYCIDHQIYDIYEINALLFEYDEPLLGQS